MQKQWFSFRIPPEYESAGLHGVDSLVERFEAEGRLFHYDWGKFSGPVTTLRNPLNPQSQEQFSECTVDVGGYPAVLATWIDRQTRLPYRVAIAWREVDGPDWVWLEGLASDAAGARELVQILRTVRFAN